MIDGPPPAIEIVGLSKSFGAFQALDRVSLRLPPGGVHALLGENGAGKSTLVKCIMGYHRADAGHVLVDDVPVRPRNPREAQALGIGMVYQHFTLVPNMTVAENLVLARARIPFVVDWKHEHTRLSAFMGEMPFRVPLDAPVRALSAGEKQKVEILKQLYLDSRVIILDEPTSVLTAAEADEALGLLRDLATRGCLSVLLITHKFREVMRFSDEVTVLRRGRVAGRGRVQDVSPQMLAEIMMGGALPARPVQPDVRGKPGTPTLRVDGLSADDDRGLRALDEVSFDVRAGEIVGIAAVAGNGQEQLVEVLAGQRPARSGHVYIDGEEYTPTRREMRRHRVRCLPEDPLRSACVPTMTVAENMVFRQFDQAPFTWGRWGLRPGRVRSAARRLIAEYGIKTPSAGTPIGQLSGGNMQRAVLARELSDDVQVLIAANPCMGLDFAAIAEIQRRLEEARQRGTAVLLVSADLDELCALADRILVMSEGRVVHETPAAGADLQVIGRHMAAHA